MAASSTAAAVMSCSKFPHELTDHFSPAITPSNNDAVMFLLAVSIAVVFN